MIFQICHQLFYVLGCLTLVTCVPVCNDPEEFQIIRTDDCSGFYICVWGVPTRMPDCLPDFVFSSEAHVCVPKGSSYDDCDTGTTPPSSPCNPNGTYQLIRKEDCSGYYLCSWGTPVEMPDCAEGHVFSLYAQTCVPKGDLYDDCPKTPQMIAEECAAGASIIRHPTECQLYYNCSHVYEYVPWYFEQYLQECPYPQLFNVETDSCENFEQVTCVARTEHVNACDYRKNKCGGPHCIPCFVRFPSCEGLGDGDNVYQFRKYSPYYVTCYMERLVSTEQCPSGLLFHPERKECVMLSCENKPDGPHLDDLGRCDQYTICLDGAIEEIVKCPQGELFDSTLAVCVSEDEACGECGTQNC